MFFIVFDTETTGVEPGSRPVELGALKVNDRGDVTDVLRHIINPFMPMPPDAGAVNGFTTQELSQFPGARRPMEDFLAFIAGADFAVAHNAPYDVGIISTALESLALPLPTIDVVDTLEMARTIKETTNNKLATLVEHYGIKLGEGQRAHRALGDAEACRLYYAIACQKTTPLRKSWSSPGHWVEDRDLPSHLKGLPVAVSKGETIGFTYTDAKGNVTSRKVTPYGWAKVPNGIAVHGLCHEKNERRTFLADRMGIR